MSVGKDVEYVEVSIEEFGGKHEIPFDIFVRLSESKYVKIASHGEDLTAERLANYKGRNVAALYLRKEDFLEYVGLKTQTETFGGETPGADAAERELFELCRQGNLTLEMVFFNEMNELVFGAARDFVDTTVMLLAGTEQAGTLLSVLNKQSQHIYAHGVAASAYSVMIARVLGWTNAANIFKLATGALLHDVGKRDIDRGLLEKPLSKLRAAELKQVQAHPVLGVKILEQVPSVPTDIIQIVLQHHENMRGTGFPNKLTRFRIHPMAKIVAAANGFCEQVLQHPDRPGLKPRDGIMFMEATGDYDPESLNALKRLFKS